MKSVIYQEEADLKWLEERVDPEEVTINKIQCSLSGTDCKGIHNYFENYPYLHFFFVHILLASDFERIQSTASNDWENN